MSNRFIQKIAYVFAILVLLALVFYVGSLYQKNEVETSGGNASSTQTTAANFFELNGCSVEMSNNAYTNCVATLLSKVQTNKQASFHKIELLIKGNQSNFVIHTPEFINGLQDWYRESNKYNEKRCHASNAGYLAGSGFKAGITECQIEETLRDKKLLDELAEYIDPISSAEDSNAEGKYKEALNIIESYLVSNPNDINAITEEGISYFGLGQCQVAMELFSKAMELTPDGEQFADRLSSTTLELFNKYRESVFSVDKCD